MSKRYLLDTAILVALLKNRPGAERLIRPWLFAHEVATSVINYGEAIEYLRDDPLYDQRRMGLRDLLREVTPYGLTYGVMERYANLRRRMRPPHGVGLIGDVDTLIAATAFEHDVQVVTLDGDFTRIPDLKVMRLDRISIMK